MKISISALSVAYGLTPEALRFYEEKGLLTPERASSRGFRQFSLNDVQRLGFIKSYQRQGFSLDEIKNILTRCPQDELIAMMDLKRAELREQLTLTRAIYDRLTAGTDLLRDSERLSMRPRLCQGCAAYLIEFASVGELFSSVHTSPVLKELIDALPLTSYCTVVPLKLLEGSSAPLPVGVCAPVEYSAAIHADFSAMRMSAGPLSVRCLFELFTNDSRSIMPVIEPCMAFIRERNLTPVCDAYTRQYAWFSDEKGHRRHYAELIIPVAE